MPVAEPNSTAAENDQHITVITTHTNADFDALASMLAAHKLYPNSLVVFPGSQEKNLRNFFIQSMVYLLNIANVKDIDFSRINRLVLVDTRQPGRIGRFASIVDRPGLCIHIYDHHPPMEDDIEGEMVIQEAIGATVTLLIDLLRQRGIDITPDEATIMCLGIYEDTGSFTFPSTTEKDFMAAAYLLSKGANLNMISNLTAREISPEQVGILNDMIQTAQTYHINGLDIVVTTVTSDQYVPDFAFLVHKMVRMEDLDAIFAVAQMDNKIYVVARSRIPEVDVAAVVGELGGGGHAYAAAATVKNRALPQVMQQLLDALHARVRSRHLARHLMSAPPISVKADVSLKAAGDMLTRYNINALLVTGDRPDALLGFITRQVIEKALHHKLTDVPVVEYMNTEMETVEAAAELREIQQKIIENKQRILPVLDRRHPVGVITRTDLLNNLVQRDRYADRRLHHDRWEKITHARTRNIQNFMRERLSARLLDTLADIGTVAAALGFSAYVVGGFVRDLFLYRSNEDIDIVIEGDGIVFAREFAGRVGARTHSHAKFGTAVIIFDDGFKIDVATARLEYYQFPAALPTVETGSIKLDLFRRDFTINTLAIQLDPKKFGTLVDFFGAQKDIKEKVIRVLHNLSFVEDPTRVFRALRFEQRFGFSIGKLTAGLIENAVKMDFFKRLSGRRVFAELRQILDEENPVPTLVRLQDYDLLNVIHPALHLEEDRINLLNSVKKVIAWHDLLFLDESYIKWAVYFMAMIRPCNKQTSEALCRRLELPPRLYKLFTRDRFLAENTLHGFEKRRPADNNAIYQQLMPLRVEMVLYMMACTTRKAVKKLVSHFVVNLRHVTTTIRGRDLMQLGLKPGPAYRDVLQAALEQKLNGRLPTRADELAFAKQYVATHFAADLQDAAGGRRSEVGLKSGDHEVHEEHEEKDC